MKILLTSVSAGSGHVRAAEAVQTAIAHSYLELQAVHIDIMNFVSKRFRRFYVGGYNVAVNHAPRVWGGLYRFMNSSWTGSRLQPFFDSTQRKEAAGFLAYVARFKPDAIVTTHFLTAPLLGHEFSQGRLHVPLHCVITDFDVHRVWIHDAISHYYVARPEMADQLMESGVPEHRITLSGIPVHPIFNEPVSRAEVMGRMGLSFEKTTLLVLSGGLGLKALERVVKRLFDMDRPVQIITVSGRNERLRDRLLRLSPPSHITAVHLGYVGNMHELLTVSDVVITKPGGLTVSECLTKGKPTLLYSPIPGQEEKNAHFLVSHMAGVKAESVAHLLHLIRRFISEPELRTLFRRNAEALAQPRAAFVVADGVARSLVRA